MRKNRTLLQLAAITLSYALIAAVSFALPQSGGTTVTLPEGTEFEVVTT